MMTITDLFTKLGGPAVVGQMIGVATVHAALMRRRGSIPANYWERLVKKSGKVTLEQLASIAAQSKRNRREEAA